MVVEVNSGVSGSNVVESSVSIDRDESSGQMQTRKGKRRHRRKRNEAKENPNNDRVEREENLEVTSSVSASNSGSSSGVHENSNDTATANARDPKKSSPAAKNSPTNRNVKSNGNEMRNKNKSGLKQQNGDASSSNKGNSRTKFNVETDLNESLNALQSSALRKQELAVNRRNAAKSKLRTATTTTTPSSSSTQTFDSTSLRRLKQIDFSGFGSTRASELAELLTSEKYECMICCEPVRRSNSIWSCSQCGTLVHLICGKKWAKTASNSEKWRCIACQTEYSTSAKSLQYTCFCGKVKNPPLNPLHLSHSCGEVCGKFRGGTANPLCDHRCTDLCHPSACAPCQVMMRPRSCFCGRAELVRSCAERNQMSCGTLCKGDLECGHECLAECHPGKCPDCSVVVNAFCTCGKKSIELPCALRREAFSCGNPCGKRLLCENHNCRRKCGHDGDCGTCESDPQTAVHCACGKVLLSNLASGEKVFRTSCLDPLPSCGSVCNAELGCLKDHKCTLLCGHESAHESCSRSVDVTCRCGGKLFTDVNCGLSYDEIASRLVCDRVCNDLLPCKKHRCRNVCCPLKKPRSSGKKSGPLLQKVRDINRIVAKAELMNEQSAGELDDSDTVLAPELVPHQCDEICGQLLNCGRHHCDVHCGAHRRVGGESECPPCGILIHDGPLYCACGAESLLPPYRCGTESPRCDRVCQKVMPCGHTCSLKCSQHEDGRCGRCLEVVKRCCVGGHGESRFVPCFIPSISCARYCGRALSCGVHACTQQCHALDSPCPEPSVTTGCGSICSLPRGPCQHPCKDLCHPGKACPDVVCDYLVHVTCECGRQRSKKPCGRCDMLESSAQNGKRNIGVRSINGVEVLTRLVCDDECVRIQRNAALADALDVPSTTPFNGSSDSSKQAIYSSFLLDVASREKMLISLIESQFDLLISGARNSVNFDALPGFHRLVVHELASVYGLDSSSSGSGPNRSTVVSNIQKTKARTPIPLLSKAAAQLISEEKQLRTSANRKTLQITITCSSESTSEMVQTQFKQLLRAHQGAYKIHWIEPREPSEIVSRSCLETTKSRWTALIEFSTPERVRTVEISLQMYSGIHLRRFSDSDELSLPPKPIKSAWDD